MAVKNIFKETEKVLKEYKAQAEEFNKQEQELNAELVALNDELTAIMLDIETASITERVYFKIRSKEVNSKTEIINKLLEELDEERTELKLQFTPILKEAQANDRKGNVEYNATEIVEKYRYLMLTEIAELFKEMQSHYFAVDPEVMDIFDDSTVKEVHPRIYYSFNQDQYKPSLQWSNEAVVHKNEIFLAKDGRTPDNLKQPKDVK